MIQEILLTTLICLGLNTMGTEKNSVPIFKNQDTTIKANPKNQITIDNGIYKYNYDLNWGGENNTNTPWTIQSNIENPYVFTTKRTLAANNEIFNIQGTLISSHLYNQTQAITQEYPDGAWIYTGEEYTNNNYTQTAFVQQFTIENYKSTFDNEYKQTIRGEITSNFQDETTWEKITITSTNPAFANYMNETTITGAYYINSLYQRITNPILGYNYTEQRETIKIKGTNTTEQIETEITYIGEATNYIYIFCFLKDELNPKPEISSAPRYFTEHYWYTLWYSKLNIKGSFIPPVDNYEVVDIPNLIFTILTLPFSFISQAFNLTLFPGTQYQINLSNLFLAFIGILIFVFILKIFLGLKG